MDVGGNDPLFGHFERDSSKGKNDDLARGRDDTSILR
jgi:hypothetical protein